MRESALLLAADLSRDPELRECRGIAGRLEHLLTEELPAILRDAAHTAAR